MWHNGLVLKIQSYIDNIYIIDGRPQCEGNSKVIGMEIVRSMMALNTQLKWTMVQVDVKSDFVYGNIDETLYMHQSEGYHDGTRKVYKIIKFIYGTKQAPQR